MKKAKPRKLRKFLLLALIIGLIFLAVGCTYYRVVQVQEEEHIAETIKKAREDEKVFILHNGHETYNLNSVSIYNFKLSGELKTMDFRHEADADKIQKGAGGAFMLKNRKISSQELHIFLSDTLRSLRKQLDSRIEFPVEDISEVRLFRQNNAATILAVVGTLAGVVVILGVIAAATKSSCPFVYSFDGYDYYLEGEIFSGAIFKPMERGDYLKLPNLIESDKSYQVVISNELKEIQNINRLSLAVVTNYSDNNIYIDPFGDPQSISNLDAPSKVFDANKNNRSAALDSIDNINYEFDDSSNDLNELQIQFDRKEMKDQMKLFLKAKSSYWVDYLWGEYAFYFGSSYNDFVKMRNQANDVHIKKWKDLSEVNLSIYIQRDGDWQLIHKLEHTGPLAYRDIVIPINISDITDLTIELKIATGYRFWDIDYIGADFSENEEIKLQYLNPVEAINQDGNNEIRALLKSDSLYVIQSKIGDELKLNFPAIEKNKYERHHYFLYAEGYYNHVREFDNLPNYFEVSKFNDPKYFLKFSRDRYSEIENALLTQ